MQGSERRRASAYSLRDLFHRQWRNIRLLMEAHGERRQQAEILSDQENAAVEALVDGTNARLRLVSRYRDRLRTSIRGLLDYVERIIEQLSDSVELSAASFAADPRVSAFFVNPTHLRQICSECADLHDFFSSSSASGTDRAYAVMLMRRVEKEVFGTAEVDGRLVRDARRKTISFTNHKLDQVRDSDMQAREALSQFLYESLVEYVNFRLTCLGMAAAEQCAPCSLLNAMRGSKDGLPNLKDPEIYLRELTAILDEPEKLLHLEKSRVRLNRIGELVAEDSPQEAFEVPLEEIHVGRHAAYVIHLVTIPQKEMDSRDDMFARAEMLLNV